MSFRSAPGSASSTLLACSTSSSPSGYLRWMSSFSWAISFSARATFSGSPEMRNTLPRCPMWTPNLCSMSLRFSDRPPARVRAPSLSVSSNRPEGSAIHARWPDDAGSFEHGLIKRRQQDKPLLRAAIIIVLPVRVAQILVGHQLAFDELRKRRRVLAVLGFVQLERRLQPHQLIVREQPGHRAATRGIFRPRGAELRRELPHQKECRDEEGEREREA